MDTQIFDKQGIQYNWITSFYDDSPCINILNTKNTSDNKCGNPWNKIHSSGGDSLMDEISKTRPKTKSHIRGCEDYTRVQTMFRNTEDTLQELSRYIKADTWAVYITDSDRNVTYTYFNTFDFPPNPRYPDTFPYHTKDHPYYYPENPNNEKGFKEKKIRTELIENPKPLLENLNNGLTLNMILNRKFIDVYVDKVPGNDLYCWTILHYL